ncbi:Mobile element protein [Geobacillus proteiniphilus]|uniref:Mobile element protein n=1 Tax=Geobacillus proteiniphilus TaxID=860353 RepID=A0A1Q5T5H8_9BACL|nr:Mobile element protein [Geobacillus proteiniphilus]
MSDPRHPLHHHVKRYWIKTIIQTVITMAGRLIRSARRFWMKLTRRNGYSEPVWYVYNLTQITVGLDSGKSTGACW